MTRRRRGLRDAQASRPPTPYLPDGTLDPREWEIACTAASVLTLVVLRDEPWFVRAFPVEVLDEGVELEVVVRWLSPEVWRKVPAAVDGFGITVVLEGAGEELHTIH